MADKFVVSSPNEWRKRSVMQVTLPNGLNVELRKPNITNIVLNSKNGDVPQGLRNQIIGQLQGKSENEVEIWDPTKTLDELSNLGGFMRTVVTAAFVNPIIVDKPDESATDPYQIAYEWLDDPTLNEVFALVMSGDEAIDAMEEADGAATFPEQA